MAKLHQIYPTNLRQAIQLLFRYISNHDKSKIAKKAEYELINLKSSLGKFIVNEFNIRSNKRLLQSCRTLYNLDYINSETASQIIIKEFWKRLREMRI
jgi:hypothetical protein